MACVHWVWMIVPVPSSIEQSTIALPRIWRLPSPMLMWVVLKRSHSRWWSFWIPRWSGIASMMSG